MEILPPTLKQQPSLRNKIRGTVYGAVAGLVVGAIGALFLGWGALLTSILVGALFGFQLVGGLWHVAPVFWWRRDR